MIYIYVSHVGKNTQDVMQKKMMFILAMEPEMTISVLATNIFRYLNMIMNVVDSCKAVKNIDHDEP